MKTDNELQITIDDFKLIKSFYPEFTRKKAESNDFIIGWSELMPVVEKIDSMMPEINIPQDLEVLRNDIHGSEMYMDVVSLPINTPIADVYKTVVEFIKWHNQQTK